MDPSSSVLSDHDDRPWITVSYRKKKKTRPAINSTNNISIDPTIITTHISDEIEKATLSKRSKPKMTVAKASAMVDANHLQAYLNVINWREQELKLMKFADYFGQAFSEVNPAQFQWCKTLRKAALRQLVDVPLAHISEDVYKTSVNWICLQSTEALESFAVWLSDQIFAELNLRASDKPRQQLPSKSLVDIFTVLAMVLRSKPNVLINVLPKLRDDPKYQEEPGLPITIWMITQASEGDIVVGLFMWTRFLLPLLSSTSTTICNSHSDELILQLVERILSSPKSRAMLLSRAVEKDERLVPPSSLDRLMRIAFPAPSARVEVTKRLKAVYPTLKEIALAGGSGRDDMKLVTREILTFAIEAAREDVPDLKREATNVFVRCLTQNPEYFEHWDNLCRKNVEASVMILKKLSHNAKDSTDELLKKNLMNFRHKNAKALGKANDGRRKAVLVERYRSYRWMRLILVIVSALCAVILSLGIVHRDMLRGMR